MMSTVKERDIFGTVDQAIYSYPQAIATLMIEKGVDKHDKYLFLFLVNVNGSCNKIKIPVPLKPPNPNNP
jgi:hypothetical protein